MKIVWLYPVNQKCGISFYSQEYVHALADRIDLKVFDIDACCSHPKLTAAELNSCDCIHIQYEPSFFIKYGVKTFARLCSLLTKPVVVTLHEIYDEFPDVFPRSGISGPGCIRTIKEWLYDRRHPYQTSYTYDLQRNFFADRVLVHADVHRDTLIQKGVEAKKITVIPLPVTSLTTSANKPFMYNHTLHLASHGFLTRHYDYPLLFQVLDKLTVPWRFTWIGGIRRDEDASLPNELNSEIQAHSWNDAFTITGWVPVEERAELLNDTDIYLALLKVRSTSASLATAIGARRLIIATDLPYTRELARDAPILALSAPDCSSVIEKIQLLLSDESVRQTHLHEIEKYIDTVSYVKMAERVIAVYKDLIV